MRKEYLHTHITDRNAPLTYDPPEELFRFHPRATNPELWRTTVPLVIRLRCNRHKGLIATWTAIHWLIVLHASSGRSAFGVRDIAAEAGVGRNELSGANGLIQRLVDLELLHIVAYERIPGFREPRPVYHIDLFELERLSLELVPDLLRERCLPPPPRPAPDPRQLSLFGDESLPEAVSPQETGQSTYTMPENGTEQLRIIHHVWNEKEPVTHVMPENRTDRRRSSTKEGQIVSKKGAFSLNTPENKTVSSQKVTDSLEISPEYARKDDIEREKEEKERESLTTLSQDSLQLLISATAKAVLAELAQTDIEPNSLKTDKKAVGSDQTPTPKNEPALPAAPLELWQADRPSISQRDTYQLKLLMNQIDTCSQGHGSYWVGRAILLAERCLEERGQRPTIAYLQTMLRRWQYENSWGSDLDLEPNPSRSAAPNDGQNERKRTRQITPVFVPEAPNEQEESVQHEAVRLYIHTFGQHPNRVQREQIVAKVVDFDAWQQVLRDWQTNAWRIESVSKMLDRYTTLARQPAPDPDAKPDMLIIYTHPELSEEARQLWMRRLSYAAPQDKAQVMERFYREYPPHNE